MGQFRGSMVAIITPMKGGVTPDAAIDWERYAALIEFHIAEGTDAIIAVGTTGESATLNEAEHCEVIRLSPMLQPQSRMALVNCSMSPPRLTPIRVIAIELWLISGGDLG